MRFGIGSTEQSLAKDDDCRPGLHGIVVYAINIPSETPLVGFHAKVSYDGISAIGPILLDTIS